MELLQFAENRQRFLLKRTLERKTKLCFHHTPGGVLQSHWFLGCHPFPANDSIHRNERIVI